MNAASRRRADECDRYLSARIAGIYPRPRAAPMGDKQNNLGTALPDWANARAGPRACWRRLAAYRARAGGKHARARAAQWARHKINLGPALFDAGGTARAARRGWRRRSTPSRRRCRNGPGARAARLGDGRKITSATRFGTLGERESGTARLEEGGRRLRAHAGGLKHARARAAPLGDDAEQPRQPRS